MLQTVHKHTLSAMDRTGDTKTIWDPENEVEVGIARAAFKKLKDAGHAIYHVKANGKPGEVMHEFDPEAEKLIAIPPIVGG